jgi:hypothetical protein
MDVKGNSNKLEQPVLQADFLKDHRVAERLPTNPGAIVPEERST